MKPVQFVSGTAVPINRPNIDTDAIIPSDWLKQIERTGFERGLFSEWRDDPDFILNRSEFSGAKILIAGENFGIGSSREHAVWALQQYGFEAIISSRFGDIFSNNSGKNGLVICQLDEPDIQLLADAVLADPSLEFQIDVAESKVTAGKIDFNRSFPIPEATRNRLINGLDDIALSLQNSNQIADFEQTRPNWL